MDDMSFERVEGPTPDGYAYSIAFFRDTNNRPVPKSRAVNIEIVEYDENDEAMKRTYGAIEKI